ncbi:MAG TPA: GGDEF domain-containing protein [Acidimicrobiales bacterium]|nr:GGDEF domain-containing protein [Acidimicrobiales bacterium]
MALSPPAPDTRRARSKGAPARPEAVGTVISARQISKFSALLWGIGCVSGELLILLPHGRGENVAGLAAISAAAGVVAIVNFWQGERVGLWANYFLSLLALLAVSAAVMCAHHSPVVGGIAGLYVLPTIFTASFYSTRAFVIYMVAQAATSGAVLLTSGVVGASAGWAVIVGTTVTVGVVVHVLQQALKVAATTDPLTGLVNRRAFEPILARELHRCARLEHPLCLVVLDLDHFKEVNDAYGHQEGDRLLAEVSRAWSETLRSTDVLARAGGDEFVLLLPSTNRSDAIEKLGRLAGSTRQGFSAGVAEAGPGSTVENLLRLADGACYNAKQTGRGQVVVADRAFNGVAV